MKYASGVSDIEIEIKDDIIKGLFASMVSEGNHFATRRL